MCELLRKKGCEVFDVGSPIGVTRLIAANQIDVVVLDVMMPDISGDKLAKLLRSNPKLLQLSIVLVSAADIVKLTKLAKDVEADAVVPKANIHRELGNVVLETYRCKTVLGLSTRKRPV
jgi:CheY-like chemotaxis protein